MFQLFDPRYLFDIYPSASFNYYLPLTIYFLFLLFTRFALKSYFRGKKAPILKRLLRKLPGRLTYLSILGFILLLIRYQNIPILSMRFFLLLVLILSLVFVGKSLYIYYKIYPIEKKRFKTHQEKDKYIPGKK